MNCISLWNDSNKCGIPSFHMKNGRVDAVMVTRRLCYSANRFEQADTKNFSDRSIIGLRVVFENWVKPQERGPVLNATACGIFFGVAFNTLRMSCCRLIARHAIALGIIYNRATVLQKLLLVTRK